MTDHLSDHQGVFMPWVILGVMMLVVFLAGLLGGMALCWWLA